MRNPDRSLLPATSYMESHLRATPSAPARQLPSKAPSPDTHLAARQRLLRALLLASCCSSADKGCQQGWAVGHPPPHPRLGALQQGFQAGMPLGRGRNAVLQGAWRPGGLASLHADGADAQRPRGKAWRPLLAVQADQGPSLHRASHAHAVAQAHAPRKVVQEHHPDWRLGQAGIARRSGEDPGTARLACARKG